MIKTRMNAAGRTEYQGIDGEWHVVPPPPAPHKAGRDDEGRSYGQRITQRNRASLKRGIHPTTGLPLLEPREHTCGDCVHHVVHHHSQKYHKCDLNATSGPATDIRVSWPACSVWEQA